MDPTRMPRLSRPHREPPPPDNARAAKTPDPSASAQRLLDGHGQPRSSSSRRTRQPATMTQRVTRVMTLPPSTVTVTAVSTVHTPYFASDIPALAAARYPHTPFGYAVVATAIGAAIVTMGIGRLWRLLRH